MVLVCTQSIEFKVLLVKCKCPIGYQVVATRSAVKYSLVCKQILIYLDLLERMVGQKFCKPRLAQLSPTDSGLSNGSNILGINKPTCSFKGH